MADKVEITLQGKTYPLADTVQGRLIVETGKVDFNKIPKSVFETLRFGFYMIKGACEFENLEFSFTFEEFRKIAPMDVLTKAEKLAVAFRPKEEPKPKK